MIFKKSLIQELLATAFGTFLILLGIIIAQRSGYLILIASKGILPNDAILTTLEFNIVRFLPLILSLTVFLSTLLTLTRWHRDSEMVIWFSAGLSITKWIRPILTFAIPIIIVITLLSLFVMPWATMQAGNYRNQLQNRDDLSTITPGVFKESPTGDRVYFIEGFDQLGKVVKNVFVQTTQHQKVGVIVADNGHRVHDKLGDNFIVLEKGRRYESVPNTAEMTITEFDEYAIRVKTKAIKAEILGTEAVSTEALFKTGTPSTMAEIQWRLALPISALILVILAIPLSFVDPRAGRSLNIFFAVFIYIIYNNLLSVMQAWVMQGKIDPHIGLWPIHIFFLLFTIYVFWRRLLQLPLFPKIMPAFGNKTVASSIHRQDPSL